MSGFTEQMALLETFFTESDNRPTIEQAVASERVVSSTSIKLRPSLSVDLYVKKRGWVHVTVPAGTSAGIYEPSSLTPTGAIQTKEKKIFDKDIKAKLIGSAPDPVKVDQMLEELNRSYPKRSDGVDTPFSRIGGSTATATSLATVLALARSAGVSDEVAIHFLYNRIAKSNTLPMAKRMSLPVFMSKIADGGSHGAKDNRGRPLNPIQEFLFIPLGYTTFTDALAATMEVTARFWRLIKEKNFEISIGAEGGIVSAQLTSAIQVLHLMSLAIQGNGRGERPLLGMFIGLDVAAGELYDYEDAPGKYYLGKDGQTLFGNAYVDYKKLTIYYQKLYQAFPIISIEDPFADDKVCLKHWRYGFPRMNEEVLVVTDDLSVTQPDRVTMATKWGVGGLLTKVNQAGSFTRAALAMQIADKHGWMRILSHRSSEAAEFAFESILACAVGSEFCKVTVGSIEGGGGGREARVNWLCNANALWQSILGNVKRGNPDYALWKQFWGDTIPSKKRSSGLPYQGALLQEMNNPPLWLKRVKKEIAKRQKLTKQGASSSITLHQLEQSWEVLT